MADAQTPHTKRRAVQYRGPSTSDEYNTRILENHTDLSLLYNRMRLSEVELAEFYRRFAKDQHGLARVLDDLEARIESLEGATTRFTFHRGQALSYFEDQEGSEFFVPEDARLTVDTTHGVVTLPPSVNGSLSKLRFTNTNGVETLPPGLEMRVVGKSDTADTQLAYQESSPPTQALYRKPGLIWERNVVVSEPHANGAGMVLYVRVPQELFATPEANALEIHPFPAFGTTIDKISYTTKVDPLLSDSDGYADFNTSGHYEGEPEANGWVVPGGWSDGLDAIVDAGPRRFIFPSTRITALRIELSQSDWYVESDNYIYSYGLSHLDLRYDKFTNADVGASAYVRFDAPEGQTISSIDAVTPQMYNTSPAQLNDYFSWEAVWEAGGGLPTSTPVPNSDHVWIKITLTGESGWSPALSGLVVEWS